MPNNDRMHKSATQQKFNSSNGARPKIVFFIKQMRGL